MHYIKISALLNPGINLRNVEISVLLSGFSSTGNASHYLPVERTDSTETGIVMCLVRHFTGYCARVTC